MQLLDARMTEPPGVCCLCEAAEDTPYVNVERNHLTDFCNLNGVKQVCWGCCVEIANLLGFVNPEEVAKVRQEAADAIKAVEEADALNALAAAIAKAQEFVVSQTKKPIKRSPV